jgi:hypothetical protein
MNYILDSYFGFGDNIYHIPFVHKLAQQGKVFIYTPFPELFQFPNVYCFKPATNLKLQLKNMTNNGLYSKSAGQHPNGQRLRFNYGEGFKEGLTITQSFEKTIPLNGDWFFEFAPSPSSKAGEIIKRAKHSKKKLCIIRLPSVRQEWACYTRAPLMEYFQVCIDYIREYYYIVTVGDIGDKEDYTGPEPSGIDEKRDRHYVNYLRIWDVVDLISKSDLVISMPCNILPICQILRKKSFFIYGGYVPHAMCNDKRFYQVGYIEPDPFCFCVRNGHDGHKCNKVIPQEALLKSLMESIKGN